MMTKVYNPWEELAVNCKRRVKSKVDIEFNWFTDLENRYCFGIIINNKIEDTKIHFSMKYIDIYKGNPFGRGTIQLVLLDKGNWELFKNLCHDLIEYLEKNTESVSYEILVERRLLNWKKLFEKESDILSLEMQMGLISELYFLKEAAIEWSIERAINAWVGAEGDNQDFAIEGKIYEIKSYILTKGEIINISSSKQLVELPLKLYLITIGLQKDFSGVTIKDMIETIDKIIGNNLELKMKFHIKLCHYGYFSELLGKQMFYKFSFKTKAAYLVDEDFPKVRSMDIDNRIIEIKYKIDMSKCLEFMIDFNKAIREW